MRQIKLYLLIAITAWIISINYCFAQNVYVISTIDKDSIHAGQPIDYTLKVNIPKDYIIDWTNINDTLSKNIEILSKGDVTELQVNDNDLIVSRSLKITTFDTGYVEIPGIDIRYSKSVDDTNSYTCRTNLIDIYVQGASIDTTASYRDIKEPIKQNFTFEESLPYVSGAFILAGIILLTIFIIRHFRKNQENEVEEKKPNIPAIITARERLSKLKEANMWQTGLLKEYYTELTNIVREYLEGQFNIEAIEMTSDEILTEVKKIELDSNTFNKLQETLITADLVKFAKANTNSTQNEEAFNNINSFVEDSYIHYQELEKKKAEEAKSKKYDFEEITTEKQETEDTK